MQWCKQEYLAQSVYEGLEVAEWLAKHWWVLDTASLDSFVMAPGMVQRLCAQRGPVTHSGQVVQRLKEGFRSCEDINPRANLVARDGLRWGRWDGPRVPLGTVSCGSAARGSTDPDPDAPVAPAPHALTGSLGASRAVLSQ